VISRSTLELAALGSHGGEIGRARVGSERLSVDDREVKPRLAVGVDGQLQLVLVGAWDVLVWGALHDGADIVLQMGVSDQNYHQMLLCSRRSSQLRKPKHFHLTFLASRGDCQVAPAATVWMGVEEP
jgi:hypothetical protein